MSIDDNASLMDDEPSECDPYEVLGVSKRATSNEVKSAYRKMALKHHPDKASDELKATAHTEFQSIALAYAVLSDPGRRKRYDMTGSTSESIVDSQDFNWSDFYADQYENAISGETIAKFTKEYKDSSEEQHDLIEAYRQARGNMSAVYENVMLSHPSADEERFRIIINAAIEGGKVKSYAAYTKETVAQRRRRIMQFDSESVEAMAHAEALGIKDKLFTTSSGSAATEVLKALIQKKSNEHGNFLDTLEAKYAPKAKAKSSKRRDIGSEVEISEEAFQAAASKLKTQTPAAEGAIANQPRSKRRKR